MRPLLLTCAAALLAFLLLAPPAWAEWVWPLQGEVVTPYRNGSDPYASGQHRGIDIAGAVGAPVVAAAGGDVRFAGVAGSSGLTVSVRSSDGRYDTSYLHLSSTAVREGDRVAAGQRIGAVGTTGTRSAAAPHLHFGVRDAASRHAYHDPLGFLPPPPATQPPPGAPAPQPSPVPIAPAPAPAPSPRRVPAGAPRRVPLPAPSPRRVPAGEPRRVPAGAPRRVPAPAPLRVPAGALRRAPEGAPRFTPGARPVPARAPSQAPAGAPRQAPAGAPGHARAEAPGHARAGAPGHVGPAAASNATPPEDAPLSEQRPHPEAASRSGPDLGLLLACLGLVAAACLLGSTRDGQQATRATRHRIARVLQPLLGRR